MTTSKHISKLRLQRFVSGLLAALGCALTGAAWGEPARSASPQTSNPWHFEEDRLPQQVGLVHMPGIVSLRPISLNELTQSLRADGAAAALSEGGWSSDRSSSFKASLGSTEMFEIHRELPELWRLRLPNDGGSFNVSYQVVAANGRPGYLSHPRHASSEIRVLPRPILPRIIDADEDTTVYEGGVDLEMQIGDAQVAGEHTGTVTITLSWL